MRSEDSPCKVASRRRFLLPVTLVVVLLIGAPAEGQFYSRDDLLAMCQDRSLQCFGYIAGIVDASVTEAGTGGRKWQACVIGVTLERMRDVIIRSLRESPDGIETASAYVSNALVTAFPCPQTKSTAPN
jgi:hypothetical protein